jgi:hypothetical protein
MRAFLLISALVFLLPGCGKDRTDNSQTTAESPRARQAENQPVSTAKTTPKTAKKPAEALPVITELKFPGPALSTSDLEIQASLAVPDNEAVIEYRWFVNSQEIFDITDPVLPREKFSAGDWVQCWVTARSGNRQSRLVKSKHIRILGTPPVFTPAPIEAFQVPGQFQYRIQASDPDAGPYDPPTLSYELLSPKDAGIRLDPKTGEISWDISEDTIKKVGEKVEIKFRVIKKGCPEVNSSFTLHFTAPKAEKTPEK